MTSEVQKRQLVFKIDQLLIISVLNFFGVGFIGETHWTAIILIRLAALEILSVV